MTVRWALVSRPAALLQKPVVTVVAVADLDTGSSFCP